MVRARNVQQRKKILVETLAIVIASDTITKRKKRSLWCKTWLLRRKEQGCYENLMRELRLEDAESYRRWIRMDTASFEYILQKVSPLIAKKDTSMREAISPGERLAVTLRYLASGESQSSLHFQFRIAQCTISLIIKNVCWAIFQALQEEIRIPRTQQEWKAIAEEFWQLWNFPMCIGAMDGKHIKITPPPGSGSLYYNYKGDFSIVLLALVDADLKFIYVDVGTNGRVSDGGIWAKSKLKVAIDENALHIPEADQLPGTNIKVPYVIVADDAFPLGTNIMKPYPGRDTEEEKRIFNYRLSRARRVSENAFGILAARFQIYRARILTTPTKAINIVLATCILHNFLRRRHPSLYIPASSLDVEDTINQRINRGDWRNSQSAMVPVSRCNSRAAQPAKEIQSRFKTFFNGSGAVPWQRDMCNLH